MFGEHLFRSASRSTSRPRVRAPASVPPPPYTPPEDEIVTMPAADYDDWRPSVRSSGSSAPGGPFIPISHSNSISVARPTAGTSAIPRVPLTPSVDRAALVALSNSNSITATSSGNGALTHGTGSGSREDWTSKVPFPVSSLSN